MRTCSDTTRTTSSKYSGGFALPTVLIASIIMLTVLLASVTSTTAIRTSLISQYYNQVAKNASDAGVVYAKACLAANDGVPTWDTNVNDPKPLQPDTDCNGTPLATGICPAEASNPCHFVESNDNIVSTFKVAHPQTNSGGKATNVPVVGSTNLLRSSDRSIWRQYNQSSILATGVASTGTIDPVYGTGSDGAITVAANKNINTDTIATGRTCADAVNYSVTSLSSNTATLSSTPGAGCLASGDEVALINLQGVSLSYINVGNYETFTIQSISTNTITFTTNKTKYYGNGASDDTNIGASTSNQRVMLQRVPNYSNVTINSGITLTANSWDGTKGGVLYFKANGTVADVGAINMTSKGYRQGGAGGVGSLSGESRPGARAGDNCAAYDGGAGWTGGQTGGYLGGGGGGYATAGQTGTNSGDGCAGVGGGTYGVSNLSQIFFGSGGSGRHSTLSVGGGIIIIASPTITVTGSLVANGGTGYFAGGYNADGSGAGGSIFLTGDSVTVGTNLVQATGGPAVQYGGAGGTGRIVLSATTISGTTSPSAN